MGAAGRKRTQVIGIGNAFVDWRLLPLQLISRRRVFGQNFDLEIAAVWMNPGRSPNFARAMHRNSQHTRAYISRASADLLIHNVSGKMARELMTKGIGSTDPQSLQKAVALDLQ